jgi:SNF2 family DNA or RNA helicase
VCVRACVRVSVSSMSYARRLCPDDDSHPPPPLLAHRWNPSTEDQAIDRVHRLGQTRPVHVFRFVCAASVEERLLQLQLKKRSMSARALAGGGGGEKKDASKLSMEELRAFFL